MRLQRANVVLENDSDYSFDSDDDFKDFKDPYEIFKVEYDDLVDDEKHQANDPQYMKLFRGVLERDALDP